MDTTIDGVALPPELDRLWRCERWQAVPLYVKLYAKYSQDRSDLVADNRRGALNAAYAQAAGFWMMLSTFGLLPAAILGSFRIWIPALILAVIAAGFFSLLLVRFVQSLKFFPHLSAAVGLEDR